MELLKNLSEKFNRLDNVAGDYIRLNQVEVIFGLSTKASKFWLESACRFHMLTKQYIVTCPECHDIVEESDYKFVIPKKIECRNSCGPINTRENMEAVFRQYD